MAMIALAVLTTTVFCLRIVMEQGGHGPDWVPINKESYWDMVGFAFFMFEGIGCLMPVMKETAVPEKFSMITAAALITLCSIYILFSFLCYYTWGGDLDESVVTEMLPPDNTFVQIVKLLYCINLIFSYPITIVPAHQSLQEYILGTSSSGKYGVPEERALVWKVNAIRTCILVGIIIITIYVADYLDKVFAIAGAVLGMTNVLLIPSICHLKLIAET